MALFGKANSTQCTKKCFNRTVSTLQWLSVVSTLEVSIGNP